MNMTTTQANANPAIRAAIEKANARKLSQLSGNAGELDNATEAQVMLEICEALVNAGFCTPAKSDPKCQGFYVRAGQRNAKMGGSDSGVPDITVWVRGLPLGIGFEVKSRRKSARVRPEQKILREAGCIYVVRSAAEVMDVIRALQRVFAGDILNAVQAALTRKT